MKKGYSGSKFGSMTQKIKSEYVKKGYDNEDAEKIGAETSAKIARKKMGKGYVKK